MPTTKWWAKEAFASRRNILEARIRAREAIRAWFARERFLEVETSALQRSPGLEPHLFAFETKAENTAGKFLETYYLHTSPEFAMKKLLAAGAGDIYQFARVFRNREESSTHALEFTMLEWYRVDCDYEKIMEDAIALVRAAAIGASLAGAQAVGRDAAAKSTYGAISIGASKPVFRWNSLESDPFAEWERISVREAFEKYAGIELEKFLGDGLTPDRVLFVAQAKAIGIATGAEDSWDDIFFRIFLEKIEVKLGVGRPTILFDYPACMAALSRKKQNDPRYAERFEIYICGLELANAFSELTDAKEQRARFESDLKKKKALYGMRYPIDEDFLAAVGGLPRCAGIALGFDRLVMLATGARSIEETLFAPIDRE